MVTLSPIFIYEYIHLMSTHYLSILYPIKVLFLMLLWLMEDMTFHLHIPYPGVCLWVLKDYISFSTTHIDPHLLTTLLTRAITYNSYYMVNMWLFNVQILLLH